MSSTFGGWRGRLLLAASAAALALVVLAGVGEWAVRYRERHRGTVPGSMSKLFYQHARLPHALVRGADYYGWVHVGRQGFRGAREVSLARPDSVFRIIAVGGSTTFDSFTSGDSAAWPARLEQVLDSVGAPRRFEVLNAGVPGYQVVDDLVRLELELHRYQPDLIILYQGHNDLFNTLGRAGRPAGVGFDPRPDEIPVAYPWGRWLERHSMLYQKVGSRLQAIRFRWSGGEQRARATPDEQELVIQAGLRDYANHVRWYLAVARSLGVDVVLPQVIYGARTSGGATRDSSVAAMWNRAFVLALADVVWNGYARFDSVARAAAADAGAAYVPASDSTLWLVDGYLPDDPVHFNDRGSWRMARHVAAAILALPALRPDADAR